jgi:hypothetical protein
MKKLFVILIVMTLLATSCKKSVVSDSTDSLLGGSTNIPLNTIGNEFADYVMIGNSFYNANASLRVTSINNGITTIKCVGTLPDTSPLKDLIPSAFKNSSGNIDGELRFKNSSEGILDYSNADHKPQLMVKYDGSVGDEYVLEKSNGTKITRTITSKSTTDDYDFNGIMIKTMTVEQDSRIPGIKKIVFRFNQHYGLISVKIIMDDDSTSELFLCPEID